MVDSCKIYDYFYRSNYKTQRVPKCWLSPGPSSLSASAMHGAPGSHHSSACTYGDCSKVAGLGLFLLFGLCFELATHQKVMKLSFELMASLS